MDRQVMHPLIPSLPLTFVLALGVSFPASAESAPNPAIVAPGRYHCHLFVSKSLTIAPGFTIQDDGSYRHDDGSKGKYAYDSAERLITFEGGSLDRQVGLVALNGKLGFVRIVTGRGTAAGMNCDTPLR